MTESPVSTAVSELRAALAAGDSIAGGADRLEHQCTADPGDARAHSFLAATLAAQGRYDEALHAADRAIELEPQTSMPRWIRAKALRGLGRRDDLDATLDLTGTEHDSLQSLIDGLLAANDPLGAMAATHELDALAPDSPTPCRLRGDVYAWLHMWDEALVQYQYAMARDVEDTRAHCAAATARYALGDFDSALALLDGALALEPHSLRARDTLYRIVSTEVQRTNGASKTLRTMPRSLFMVWTAECRVRG